VGPLEQTTIDRWPLSSGWSQSGKVLVLAVAAALVLSGLFLAVPFFFPLLGGFLLALICWRTFPLPEVETDGRVLFVSSLRKRAEVFAHGYAGGPAGIPIGAASRQVHRGGWSSRGDEKRPCRSRGMAGGRRSAGTALAVAPDRGGLSRVPSRLTAPFLLLPERD